LSRSFSRAFLSLATCHLSPGTYPSSVNKKGKRIAAMVEQSVVGPLDPHYTGYFELFNQGKFFEAHDVLEHLWLADRQGPNGAFHKGLIQLAGAFVHLQRNRPPPAASLFKLALANLEKYPATHEHLNLKNICGLIGTWLADLERTQFKVNPLTATNAPQLKLEAQE